MADPVFAVFPGRFGGEEFNLLLGQETVFVLGTVEDGRLEGTAGFHPYQSGNTTFPDPAVDGITHLAQHLYNDLLV